MQSLLKLVPFEILGALLALFVCALLLFRTTLHYYLTWRNKGQSSSKKWFFEVFYLGAAVIAAAYLAADVNLKLVDEELDRSALAVVSVVSVIAVLLFAAVASAAAFGEGRLRKGALVGARAAHLLIVVGMALWFGSRTELPTEFPVTDEPLDSMNLMEEATEYLAVTDAGTQIPLYHIDLRTRDEETRQYVAAAVDWTPDSSHVIPRASASIHANCHGWVFTGGRFLVRGENVDQILRDNGYTVQGDPQPGDIIVYRSEYGEVLHTGIVSGILLDGTCIIESKWGITGRYLHQAEDQPYGLNYAFYRSERSGHLVTVIHSDEAESFLAQATLDDEPSTDEDGEDFESDAEENADADAVNSQ